MNTEDSTNGIGGVVRGCLDGALAGFENRRFSAAYQTQNLLIARDKGLHMCPVNPYIVCLLLIRSIPASRCTRMSLGTST